MELTGSGLLVNARVFQPLAILAGLAATYLVPCLTVSLAGRRRERRWAAPEHKALGLGRTRPTVG